MPYSEEDPKHRQKLLIGGIGGAALVCALALLFIFRPWQKPPPPHLGGEPSKLAEFSGTADFQKMPFEKREVYMKMMNTKKEQIIQAYANGQLSLEDYQKALLAAHLGKQLDDMRKYYAKPIGPDRTKYLDKLLNKKDVKEEERKKNPTAREQKKEQDLLKDDVAEKAEVSTWPGEVQAQYNAYREALAERKKIHKSAKEAAKPATNEATAGAAKPAGG
jgi:hypothetical protein